LSVGVDSYAGIVVAVCKTSENECVLFFKFACSISGDKHTQESPTVTDKYTLHGII